MFTDRVAGKVIFSQACVIHFVYRVVYPSMHLNGKSVYPGRGRLPRQPDPREMATAVVDTYPTGTHPYVYNFL